MKVPYFDLDQEYQKLESEIKTALDAVLTSKKFIQGDFVKEFSKNFCEVHGGKFGVGCANGTSAITVALRALGVGPGDEVITTCYTFIATVEAIIETGATPVLVDCRADNYAIDTSQIEAKISKKTKMILPVHLYGNPVNMDEITKIATKHNLKIVEDCAQAHLAKFNNQAVGTFGDAGTFSFYPGKNLGAYGDAGMVIVNDATLYDLVQKHIDHGRIDKYFHEFSAGNYRMDGFQGAILNVKLKYLEERTKRRKEIAQMYDYALKPKGIKVMEVLPDHDCVYHLYVAEFSNRDEVMEHFKKVDIGCGIHYPTPVHLQPAMQHLEYGEGSFAVAEKIGTRILTIPCFPDLANNQVEYVISELLKVAKN